MHAKIQVPELANVLSIYPFASESEEYITNVEWSERENNAVIRLYLQELAKTDMRQTIAICEDAMGDMMASSFEIAEKTGLSIMTNKDAHEILSDWIIPGIKDAISDAYFIYSGWAKERHAAGE